ncbi:hypothetical protein DIURU_000745 [Diutina rugosa]|uniref:glucan 1,4-alpha-glucosidase n=1 Tax=Diutina rugosa TaxID=5481 RepID=A0A642UX34_DIURU|nr:uncharacterized protein DIURU_000745 [Diutina rugosa]KAA8907061.1 hypothetical protein DIURU_000745 [Diutina rugosa]
MRWFPLAVVAAFQQPLRMPLDEWAVEQSRHCVDGILANIGKDAGVPPGVVVASPSKRHPDYFYQWTRDSALVMSTLLDIAAADKHYRDVVVKAVGDYVDNQYKLQRLDTLSGTFSGNRSGLGEPKYYVNNTAFNQSWGRPQSDGPALRVVTIARYLDVIGDKKGHKIYEDVVRYDLEYVLEHWQQPGFDLWEEIEGLHFYTALVQSRAIEVGIQLASRFGDKKLLAKLEEATPKIISFIKNTFPRRGVIIETPEEYKKGNRRSIDVAVVLASLHTHGANSSVPFDVDNILITNSLGLLVEQMRAEYDINKKSKGVAIGRYTEDIYDGYETSQGNPWFLATAGVAEAIYRVIIKHHEQDTAISFESTDWLARFTDNTSLKPGTREYSTFAEALFGYADSFLDVIRIHSGEDGSLSEQFNRHNGFMQGAPNLTWSYAAVWSAIQARSKAQTVLKSVAKL